MRKRYHFQMGKHCLDAWDVDRLIELSRVAAKPGYRPDGEEDRDVVTPGDTGRGLGLVMKRDDWHP